MFLVEGIDLPLTLLRSFQRQYAQNLVVQFVDGLGELSGVHIDKFEHFDVEAGVVSILEFADGLGVVAARFVDHARQPDDAGDAGVGGSAGRLSR